MPVFNPPTADLVSPVYRERDRYFPVPPISNRLFRYYKKRARGQSVLKIAGVYSTVTHPTTDDIESATEYYQGGKVYTVSAAVATALNAAGYTTTSDVTPPDALSYTWNSLAGMTYDQFAETYPWIG